MKRSFRLFSLLLCIGMLANMLGGCAAPRPEPSPAPTAAATPEPTPEPLDVPGLYAGAVEKLSAAENLKAEYTLRREITLPDYAGKDASALMTLCEETTRSARYQGLGGDAPLAVVEDRVVMDDSPAVSQKLVYTDGIEFVDIEGSLYYAELSSEDFFSAQLPIILLDASLFDTLEAEEQSDGYVLRFSDPAGAPEWAMPAEAELLDASGSANISADGRMTAAAYELRFRFGGLTVSECYEAAFELPGELDLSAEIPEKPKKYESLDDPSAPLAILRAEHMLRQATVISAEQNIDTYIEAAAAEMRDYNSVHMLRTTDGVLFHEESTHSVYNYYNNSSGGGSVTADYADGVMTMVYSNGETETDELDDAALEDKLRETLLHFFPGVSSLKDAESKTVGDYLLFSFAGNDEYGLLIKDTLSIMLFGEENATVIDDLSSAYRTKSVNGYLGVERISGIPTSLGLTFTGIHTVEGQPLAMELHFNLGLSLFTEDACREIYDEPLAGPEPENKPTPVFYEVTDEEGNKMFLFGTIHIGDDRTAFLPQVIYDALDESDALAVEFDTDRFDALLDEDDELRSKIMEAYYYTDGTTIQNHIDSDIYKQALDLMKVSGSYSDFSENLKPYLWGNTIDLFYLSQGRGLSSEKGVDNRLLRLARAAEKEILDVESGEFQISMICGYSDAVQEVLLAEICDSSRSEYLQGNIELFESWCEGDEAALIELLSEMDEEDRAELDEEDLAIYDEYHQKMEVERNANMVEVAKSYLQGEKTVFFAVGLAHLLGEGGLVEALRSAGYTVTLIDVK